MRRPTIADIARAAGVSKGAVSYALNGRPGVSEATRGRILAIAEELGWAPSSAARALSDGRAGAVGLVVARPADVLGIEPFFMRLISGIQSELAGGPTALTFQMAGDLAAETATYRRWAAERRVDGVLLVDLRVRDPRVDLLTGLALPAVVIGGPDGVGALPCVWSDDAAAVREVVHYLVALGHRRLTRVAGPPEFAHTAARSAAFAEVARELGLERAETVHADYSVEDGARVTRRLLAAVPRPTALLYDNDLMAVAGLGVAQEMGVAVPAELSVVGWDDSALCRLVRPALTTVSRDVVRHGAEAARMLLAAVAGGPVPSRRAPAAALRPRGSTGPLERP
ncbi:LacI family DNA-binding transcriptional regulator [Marinitenerispora sediminis]|uniref:LacI family transcriptional regulator n=1 Tax=Marinitenerispora sediminis TaxID=1931232 RepID=A0A368TBZ8_9ACTN|nr:LacI family DNA-binding transcriptional regulator [Marinitenerispora sediminis]RCV48478.1 LacI family transcriptional regulator [Marinitenerispora sediminis]RCV50048.1 LacI family transcriptional regulator [Marinitenerispora sediminis]RCV62471.1 LacI family transcriptional regulator [Marinitenerispora sediminis]